MVKIGVRSKNNLIYSCSKCHNVRAFLEGEMLSVCEFCSAHRIKQKWLPKREIMICVRNVTEEIEKRKTWLDHFSDKVVYLFGSGIFLFLHIIFFVGWLIINFETTPFPAFDSSWELLTMLVSLEAIFLSIFILINQKRAAEVFSLRSELDYLVDLKSEKRSIEILELLKSLNKKK